MGHCMNNRNLHKLHHFAGYYGVRKVLLYDMSFCTAYFVGKYLTFSAKRAVFERCFTAARAGVGTLGRGCETGEEFHFRRPRSALRSSTGFGATLFITRWAVPGLFSALENQHLRFCGPIYLNLVSTATVQKGYCIDVTDNFKWLTELE